MNLDDFIVPSSIGSPAGVSPTPSGIETSTFSAATASAIPIRKQQQIQDQDVHVSRASAPSVPPTVLNKDEFGYVQRHVHKTSIDERRVRLFGYFRSGPEED